MIRMELAEVSAAKSIVQVELEDLTNDPIAVADTIVEALLKAGVLIPKWIVDPVTGKPAQGDYPTATQMEAWEGRKITPVHVTNRGPYRPRRAENPEDK